MKKMILLSISLFVLFSSFANVQAQDSKIECSFDFTINGNVENPQDYPDFVSKHVNYFLNLPAEFQDTPYIVTYFWTVYDSGFQVNKMQIAVYNDSEHEFSCSGTEAATVNGFHNGEHWINIFVYVDYVEIYEDYDLVATFIETGTVGNWRLTNQFENVYSIIGPNVNYQFTWNK